MFTIPDFYPTPQDLGKRMLGMLKTLSKYEYFLEPSAGKGDLVQCLYDAYGASHRYPYGKSAKDYIKVDVVEIDPRLNAELRGNGYNVVGEDFLQFEPYRFYDLILANFPFSDGCDHLLKAIRIQERIGGDVLCLLNAETLRNPFSLNRRLLVNLLEEYGATIEYIQEAFVDAERSTDVEIAMIYVHVPMTDTVGSFEQKHRRENPELQFKEAHQLAAKQSKVAQLVMEYNLLRKSTEHMFLEEMKLRRMLAGVGLGMFLGLGGSKEGQFRAINFNESVAELNLMYWRKLIDETDFLKRLPSELRNSFLNSMQRQSDIPFTMENVRYFCDELMNSIPQSYEKTVARVFDSVTCKYAYTDSTWNTTVHYFDGWKTNNAFKVNKKVIIRAWELYYYLPDTLRDLNTIFENISGKRDPFIISTDFMARVKSYEKKVETEFFLITYYRKGTLHIEFKHPEYVKQFNILACKGKNWLPDSFGKKTYRDMDEEERACVLSFGLIPDDYDQLTKSSFQLRIA